MSKIEKEENEDFHRTWNNKQKQTFVTLRLHGQGNVMGGGNIIENKTMDG